MSILSNKT